MSNLYQVLPFNESASAADGNVLIIRRGRKTAGKESAAPAVMVEIPALSLPSLSDEPEGMIQAFQNAFDAAQAEMVKALINSGEAINEASTNLAATIAYLNREASGRVSKEKIAAWFDASNMAELLATAAVEKNPNVDESLITKLVTLTKSNLTSLAAPGTDLGEANSAKFLALVNQAQPANNVRSYLLARLSPKKVEQVDLDDLI